MRKGEIAIVGVMAVSVVLLVFLKNQKTALDDENLDVPFYSTASKEVTDRAAHIMHEQQCKKCHSMWGVRDLSQVVPAPALDGMGMFRDEEWLYNYFSAENPQEILASRLKPEYRMPSFAFLSEQERRDLANYVANLKVYDWFYEDAKKARYEKLTGKDFPEND
jgi:mono/diheme cytochrome c family protein